MEAVCAAPDAAASPGEERCHQNHQSRRTSSNSINNNSNSSRERVVYLRLGSSQKIESATFRSDTAPDELKELFRSAAEAGPLDIVKLYGADGRLINISPTLQSNTADKPYRLEVVAAHCNGMLLDEVGIDLRALEERVALLEKQIQVDFEELPPSVQELKTQVDKFRTKLETTEHLSWLGFYKDLPPPLSTEACRRLQYRRKSDSVRRRVRDKFYKICDVAVSDEVRHRLRQPTFDGCQWEDEEVLLLLQQMYIDLDLTSKFCIEMPVLRRFLYEVYNNYNEVPFHNFRHSFCVAQMMYAMMWAVDLPSKLGDLETLILLTSCICHDLDHPGYNNIYQINAKTELALRYNDISPLENHHCSVAFRLLERSDCNILKSLNPENFRRVREGIIRCILATDMARHNEILAQFRDIIPSFDFNDRAHTNLLCMVLIKVADISNEARPMDVAEPWLDRLLQEFFKQSDAEKLEGLPVTPFMDRDKITKPSSQCSFIGFVLLPLFEALGELFPQLQDLIVQPVRDALDYYRRLNEAAKDEHRAHRKSVAEASGTGTDGDIGSSGGPMVKSNSGQSVKSRRTFGSLGSGNLLLQSKSRSRSAEDETVPEGETFQNDNLPANTDLTSTDNMSDVAEEENNLNSDDIEEEDETVTEVEVSEKTLKFKIATSEGRRSYPGSRKGSRDRDGETTSYAYGGRKRSVASPATSSGGGVGGSLELCNGGGRGSSPRSSSDSRPGDKETCSSGDAFCSSKMTTVNDVQLVSASAKPSFLSRIRNFTERFTFGSSSASGGSQEVTPTKQKAVTSAASSLPSLNRGTSTSTETDGRAMTLPKTRKPNRPRGWRALLSSGGRAETVSSMEVIPSTASPSKKQKNLPVESQESETKLIVDKNNVNQHNRRGQDLETSGTNNTPQNNRGNSSGWMSSFAENLRSGGGSRHRGNKGASGSGD